MELEVFDMFYSPACLGRSRFLITGKCRDAGGYLYEVTRINDEDNFAFIFREKDFDGLVYIGSLGGER